MMLALLPQWLTNGSPTTFVAEILIAFALIIGFAALTLGHRVAPPISWDAQSGLDRWITNERRTASRLGLTFRNWVMIRVVFFAVATAIGVLSQLPLLMVAGVAAGIFGINWVMTPRLSKRQLTVERLFLNEIKTMRNRVFDQGMSLDKSIREMAENCDKALKEIMAPILEDARLDDRLIKVDERAHSTLVSQICGSLIIARTHDPAALKRILDNNLIPLGEEQQEVGNKAQVLLTTQHSYIRALTALLIVFLLASQQVPSFHALYSSLGGQFLLIGDLAIFTGLLYIMGRFLRVPKGYWVNVAEVSRRLGGNVV